MRKRMGLSEQIHSSACALGTLVPPRHFPKMVMSPIGMLCATAAVVCDSEICPHPPSAVGPANPTGSAWVNSDVVISESTRAGHFQQMSEQECANGWGHVSYFILPSVSRHQVGLELYHCLGQCSASAHAATDLSFE